MINTHPYVVFACDKEQFEVWCMGRMIDTAGFIYTVVGLPKAPLKAKLDEMGKFNIIILRNWQRKETVDFDICNRLLQKAQRVFTAVNMHPIVRDGKIVNWSIPDRKIAGLDRYFLPYKPASHKDNGGFSVESIRYTARNYPDILRKFPAEIVEKALTGEKDREILKNYYIARQHELARFEQLKEKYEQEAGTRN